MENAPKPLGELLQQIVRKSKPAKRALKGRRLAQKAFQEKYGERASHATVASVKVGVVTIETDSSVLFQELEGFEKAALLETFRGVGLNVREVRVKLMVHKKLKGIKMSVRNERLKEIIREEAAQMILHELVDPRIGFCTVTRIDLAQDLSACTIHVSVMGDDGVKSRTMHALRDATGLVQSRVGKQMKTRTTPKVNIKLDESIEKMFDIEKKIREARASDPDPAEKARNR